MLPIRRGALCVWVRWPKRAASGGLSLGSPRSGFAEGRIPQQLAARGRLLAVAMVWNFPVFGIFRQQHTYKCVVKLDACRGRLGPPGLLTKPMFQWRSKFDFSPPSLSSSFFSLLPHPSFAKEASVTGEKNWPTWPPLPLVVMRIIQEEVRGQLLNTLRS